VTGFKVILYKASNILKKSQYLGLKFPSRKCGNCDALQLEAARRRSPF